MPKPRKRAPRKENAEAPPIERSQHDRAPYQKESDRNPVKSAEETRHIPPQHGAIK